MLFSDDVRPNTYVTKVHVDAICKQVADKYGLEGLPKIAYGVAQFDGYNSHLDIDFTSAGFTSPPVVVGVRSAGDSTVLAYNQDVLQLVTVQSNTSAHFMRSNASTPGMSIYWMAMGT